LKSELILSYFKRAFDGKEQDEAIEAAYRGIAEILGIELKE